MAHELRPVSSNAHGASSLEILGFGREKKKKKEGSACFAAPNNESTPVQKRKVQRDEDVPELAAVPGERRSNPGENQQAAAVAGKLLLCELLSEVGSELQGQRAVTGGNTRSRERCGGDRRAAECGRGLERWRGEGVGAMQGAVCVCVCVCVCAGGGGGVVVVVVVMVVVVLVVFRS